MLSPLQVIYALKSKDKHASDFFKFDKFNKGWAVMTSFKMTRERIENYAEKLQRLKSKLSKKMCE
jgi:hypothetical protein